MRSSYVVPWMEKGVGAYRAPKETGRRYTRSTSGGVVRQTIDFVMVASGEGTVQEGADRDRELDGWMDG